MSERLDRFYASMVMDFDKWHDGLGYDIDLIDEMTPEEKASVQAKLVNKLDDWRDLEALDRLGTPGAVEAIVRARNSTNSELRIYASRYGPPDENARELAILDGLNPEHPESRAFDDAGEFPSPKIIEALWECAEKCTGVEGYQAAIILLYVHGKVDSPHTMAKRALCLRFTEAGRDHDEAVKELHRIIAGPAT